MIYIDTHKEIEALMKAGFTKEQAEGQVYGWSNCFKDALSPFVTNKTLTMMSGITLGVGGLIFAIAGFILVGIWNLEKQVNFMDHRLTTIEETLKSERCPAKPNLSKI